MGVLLAILKFIGLLLLGILLLVLLLVIVIMCVPLKYRLRGQKNGEIRGEFYLRWLFGAIIVRVAYLHGKEPKISIKIFGRELGRGKKKAKKQKAKKQKGRSKEKTETAPDFLPVTEGDVLLVASESVPEELPPEKLPTAELLPEELLQEEPIEEVLIKEESLINEEPPEPEPSQEVNDKTIARMAMEDTPPTKRLRRVKLSEVPEPELNPDGRERRIAFDEEDEAFFIGEVPDEELADGAEAGEESKLDKAKMIWGKVQEVEDKKAIFIALKKLLGRVIKGVLPQDMFLKATVGTGDPTTTGYVMGLAGMLVAKFGDNVQIKGDFTKATLEDMEVRIKGRIILGKFVYAALAFIGAKPVRKTLWRMWKGRSKKNG